MFLRLMSMRLCFRRVMLLVLASLAFTTDAATIRFMSFNIWGDWVNNYVCERDVQQAEAVLRRKPDVLALQEMTPNYWKSRFLGGLTGFTVVGERQDWCNYVPLAFRADRFELLDSGSFRFDAELEYTKGATWAVLRDRAEGVKVIVFSTHFWWKVDRITADDYIRMVNARELVEKLHAINSRYPDAVLLGGGDLNAIPGSRALVELARGGFIDVQPMFPEVADVATYHNMPERIPGTARWRGFRPGEGGRPTGHIFDHVIYQGERVKPVSFDVDMNDDFQNVSDHYPLIVDFELTSGG